MDIAKPPDGFIIDEPAGVTSAIAAHAHQWPRLKTHWADIKSRLQQVGHREGVPVKNGPPGARIFVAEGDEASGLPAVKVAYSVLGDTLRIRMVLIG
jgi:hypothetical protein